jgi:hypothetical protein
MGLQKVIEVDEGRHREPMMICMPTCLKLKDIGNVLSLELFNYPATSHNGRIRS